MFSAVGAVHPHGLPHHLAAPITYGLLGGGKTTTALAAPSSLTANLSATSDGQLAWKDNCTTASGYYVLRSIDGGAFSKIATVASSTASSYTDSTLNGGHTYTYEAQAYGGGKTTPVSNKASLTVKLSPPAAPTALVASTAGSWITLAWTASAATGYDVLRSTDGVSFAQIAQGAATSYTDTAVVAGQSYDYEVEAYNASGTSAPSNLATLTAPTPSSAGSVTIGTRFGDELVVTAAGADDSVAITESGSTLSITADGQTYAEPAPLAGVFVYTRGGSDGISIDASVTTRTTVDTIDGATTAITSAGTNVSAWIDSTDTYSGTGTVHRVSAFAGGVSKAIGASLPNPTDSGTTTNVNLSLWGTGPVAGDVNQGEAGDCYFMSSLAAFAGVKPSLLMESAVDLGDGTYAVQYHSAGTPVYVRVSGAMPTGPFAGFAYAQPGVDQTMWAMVMEKAFAYFRTGANSYASTNSGWMSEAYGDLGVSSTDFVPSSYSDSTFSALVVNDLNNHEAVTLATTSAAPNLVSNHAYTLISVSTDSSGVNHYVVRNPWGDSGDALENAQGYATLTFAQVVANFTQGTQAVG